MSGAPTFTAEDRAALLIARLRRYQIDVRPSDFFCDHAADLIEALQAQIKDSAKEIERTSRNRDMWRDQSGRQAEKLTAMCSTLSDERAASAAKDARIAELERSLRGRQRFQIGDAVEAASTCPEYLDWLGAELYVATIRADDLTGDISIETSDEWPPKSGRTDGWSETDLSPRLALHTATGEKS
ncbi:hypothetical protein [Hansschlegelia plantiphila]|uniref:Uncharacterized protein n=1 Tax=Hansschlegelia plantiphila TaxID=374655 RepID=A0A9W6J1R7_9HYPH|nr:hypothetical protein [Hansschlegelia plantiphila]GLK69225.1 hypothetical protein GCM10008179_28630 [Hansschlegelia plantiphila]